VLHENGRQAGEDRLCENGLASGYKPENTKKHGVGFRALLAGGGVENLELVRA
jgi:hypothetical protein